MKKTNLNLGCKDMKIIYVQCGWRNEYRIDPRSYEHYWTSGWIKALKKFSRYGIWTHDLCDTIAALNQLS